MEISKTLSMRIETYMLEIQALNDHIDAIRIK